MQYKIGKFFKKQDKFCVLEYDKNLDYYQFVKNQRDIGYKQVILTSQVMIDLITRLFIDKKFGVASLELNADDQELSVEINSLIDKMNKDRDVFSLFLAKLDFLTEDNSIDIKKVELNNKKDTAVFLQVNGIFGINSEKYMEESDYLLNKLMELI